jgi:hypothetical protein
VRDVPLFVFANIVKLSFAYAILIGMAIDDLLLTPRHLAREYWILVSALAEEELGVEDPATMTPLL